MWCFVLLLMCVFGVDLLPLPPTTFLSSFLFPWGTPNTRVN